MRAIAGIARQPASSALWSALTLTLSQGEKGPFGAE